MGEAATINKHFRDNPLPDYNKEEQAKLKVVQHTRTTPRDARFPSSNQAGHCWNRYNEWLLCKKEAGEDDACKVYRQRAVSICPSIWTEKWDEERDEGTFAGVNV